MLLRFRSYFKEFFRQGVVLWMREVVLFHLFIRPNNALQFSFFFFFFFLSFGFFSLSFKPTHFTVSVYAFPCIIFEKQENCLTAGKTVFSLWQKSLLLLLLQTALSPSQAPFSPLLSFLLRAINVPSATNSSSEGTWLVLLGRSAHSEVHGGHAGTIQENLLVIKGAAKIEEASGPLGAAL